MVTDLSIGRTNHPLAILLFYSTISLTLGLILAIWRRIIPRIISILSVGISLFFDVFLFSMDTIWRLLLRSPARTNQVEVAFARQYGFSDTEIIFLNIWVGILIILSLSSIVVGLLSIQSLRERKLY